MAGSAVIGSLRVNLGIDSAQFSNGLKQVQSGLSRFGAAAKAGMAAAAVGVGLAAGKMLQSVQGSIDAADDMSKAASKFGVPIEELSRLKYAADLSGVSFEGLGTSIGRLSRLMNDAKNGNAAAAETFEQVGVSATNADGSLKSASQVLTEIANKFATMPDGAEKTALAMDLMGRSGANMIPLLNGGGEALEKLKAEADTFGQVFTAEMGTNAEAFNDNISRLQGAFGNLAARIATELLPYLRQFTDWLVANGPAIAEWSGSVARAVAWVINEFVRFKNEAVQFGQQVAAIYQFFADLGTSLGQLGAQIATFLSGSWAAFEAAWDGTVQKVNGVKQALMDLGKAGLDAMIAMVNGITDWVGNKLNAVWEGLTSKINAVGSAFSALYHDVVGGSYVPDMVTEVGAWMGKLDGNMVKPAADAATKTAAAFEGASSSIGSAFSGLGSSIAELIKGTTSWRDVLSDVAGQLAQMALSNFSRSAGGAGGFLSSLISGLTGFATGGSFTVGGSGGIDSQVRALRLTPGEKVSVSRPGDEREMGGGPTTLTQEFYIQGAISDKTVMAMVMQGAEAAKNEIARSMPGILNRWQRDGGIA
jgi:hypothetical protein